MPDEIINTHDQLTRAAAVGLPGIAIVPRLCPSSSRSRPTFQSGWEVFSVTKSLMDKSVKRSWYDQGDSRIFDSNHDKIKDFEAAKDWASKIFGITEWKRNRMHAYVDARVANQFPLRSNKKQGEPK